jgi:hypothetical protein
VTGLFCHRRRRNAKHRRPLDASVGASGPHDFAVRLMRHSSKAPKRPPHPAPNVRDDSRNVPLGEAGRGELVEMICPTAKGKYFLPEDWTTEITWPATLLICPSGKPRRNHVHRMDRRSIFQRPIISLNGRPNLATRISAALAVDEAAHNYGGGDATGNAAFAPRLPLKPAPPNRQWVSPSRRTRRSNH